MKFKSFSIPKPTVGKDYSKEVDMCVPDQSMSLMEIIKRFTRGEVLPVGKDVSYHESDDDLEKISHADLVDKAEFIEKLEDTKRAYDRQEKAKAKKEREEARAKLVEEERAKLKAEEDSAKAKLST